MPYKEVREIEMESYNNPELVSGLEALDEMRRQRETIALTAAKHIIDNCEGETLDLRVYYAAMFGRSFNEGIYEHDPNLLVTLGIARKLKDPKNEGQPLLIRAVNYPEHNVDVGVVASFSEDSFEPFKFEVAIDREFDEPYSFVSWKGALSIAMRKVVSVGSGDEATFELAEEVTSMPVCETSTWVSNGGLEIHSKGTGGVETGTNVHLNSQFSSKYHDKQAFWLRQHLAPTKAKQLDMDLERYKLSMRRIRQEAVTEQGISEARASAQGLSPTIQGFFETLSPYAKEDELTPIDTKAVFEAWHDSYDAQSLLAEVQLLDLVELDKEGEAFVTPLGRDTLKYLTPSEYCDRLGITILRRRVSSM